MLFNTQWSFITNVMGLLLFEELRNILSALLSNMENIYEFSSHLKTLFEVLSEFKENKAAPGERFEHLWMKIPVSQNLGTIFTLKCTRLAKLLTFCRK